jgi:hypothetical protein
MMPVFKFGPASLEPVDFKVVDRTEGPVEVDRYWIRLAPKYSGSHNLPIDHSYPVFASALALESLSEVRFPHLAWGLMHYLDLKPESRSKYQPALLELSKLLMNNTSGSELFSGRNWTFRYAPVDLGGETVTIQQRNQLLAAIANDSGGLKIACYQLPSLRMASQMTGLSMHPGPNGTVAMRENNWEYALDQAAPGLGKAIAAEAGRTYLSYWSSGIGQCDDGEVVSEWYEQRQLRLLDGQVVAPLLRVFEAFG